MPARKPRPRPAAGAAPPLQMPTSRRIPRVPDDRPESLPPKSEAGIAPGAAKSGGELSALTSAVRACEACTRATPQRAFGSGHPRSVVMLVKGKPSEADLRAETAFVDEAEALGKAFDRLGIGMDEVYGTSAVRCATRDARPDELHACSSHLLVEIEAVGPRVIVAFGAAASAAMASLDGRCGLKVGPDLAPGQAEMIRAGLHLLVTQDLPAGITQDDSKRRLWRDLQTLPGLLGG